MTALHLPNFRTASPKQRAAALKLLRNAKAPGVKEMTEKARRHAIAQMLHPTDPRSLK
jgi:hypothetical protein